MNTGFSHLDEMLQFAQRMLETEIEMQGMIAENKYRVQCGKTIAYGEGAFAELITRHRIGYNDYPYYQG